MESVSDQSRPIRLGVNDVLHLVLEIFLFVSLGIWGFLTWPFPWNIVVGIVAPLLAILIWALFLSPRAVIAIDSFGRALVEIALVMAAALAWFTLGQPIVAVVFAVLAIGSGVIAGRKALT
ncbi:YrdB family protein [Herbiconiux oxytropis]|uniref:YrdB family protein n=1 Tax=Herbiconiux oxytropis TaxID=2970915 RepID=UPI0035C743C4